MPNAIDRLPDSLRDELNLRLLSKRYSYPQLVAWLEEKGHAVSHSTLHRHAKKLRSRAVEPVPLLPPTAVTEAYFEKLKRYGALMIQRERIEAELQRLREELLHPWQDQGQAPANNTGEAS